MAATLVDQPFDHPDWIFEPKFDGLRVLVRFDGRQLTLISRNDKPQDAMFPDVAEALRDALPQLRQAVEWSDRVRWTEFREGKGKPLFHEACHRGDEGIIGKLASSRYVGRRDPAWVKIKCLGRQEFVIGGFTDPQRSRVGLGALLVGYYHQDRLL
jgi:ATP-dependent DNA ligase